MRGLPGLLAALAGFGFFLALVLTRPPLDPTARPEVADRVVLSAPVQLLLAGGDRFLAANFEAIRAVSTGSDDPATAEANASFRIRAHRVVAQLNPCHEDNYYVANALLTWAGSPDEGMDVLRRATACRVWDELPPFFYGTNQWFFRHNTAEARRALELAADRSPTNAAALRKAAIMISAGEYREARAALAYLESERDHATDAKLRDMLDKRVQRLAGLIQLREAQQRYEAQTGQPLTDPQALIDQGLLAAFPNDPLRLGYEFVDGRFRLRQLKIPGLENPK